MDTIVTATRSQRLKAQTQVTHEGLDQRIMRAEAFASRANYLRFVQVQARFHADIAPLYERADLLALLPDLHGRQRLQAIHADLQFLQATAEPMPGATQALSLAAAMGWLYVAEGSNLGAAVLFKLVAALGLNEQGGAAHLAGHPEGRMRHWRSFTGVLDAMDLDAQGEADLVAGGRAAFERVRAHVDDLL